MWKYRFQYIILFCCIATLGSCFKKYTGKISIDGSSSVYPLTEAVAEEYRKIDPNIKIMVGVSGTGGGFKKFLREEIDISNASRPISESEIELANKNGIQYIEIPVSYDGMAIVVSPKNTFVDYITVSELKKIWSPESQNKITTWKQVRSSWPDQPLNLYGAGTSSGTYDYFTLAINGKAKASRGDYTASEDDNVLVQGVSSDPNSLGYFGLIYYEENKDKLKLIPVKAADDGNAVYPNDSTVQYGIYQPLTRPEFIYVNLKAAKKPHIQKFIKFYMDNAENLSKEIGYVPLPPEVYQISYDRFLNGKTGTIFGTRSIVGVNLIEALKENQ
ncbi:MAG: PstS family phosphate ABC transporter substrate-binding protein [Flavisolibacter sp.]